MTTYDLSDATTTKLEELLRANIDSEKGLREAAELVDDAGLAGLFRQIAGERAVQARELQSFVAVNEGDSYQEGSYAAAVHRTWMQIREALSMNNTVSILSEAEFGEDQIKSAYEDALKETAGSPVNDVLQRHYFQVKTVHDQVRDLRDQAKKMK
jgi:uncharacterized protein (TIGR02284 family)